MLCDEICAEFADPLYTLSLLLLPLLRKNALRNWLLFMKKIDTKSIVKIKNVVNSLILTKVNYFVKSKRDGLHFVDTFAKVTCRFYDSCLNKRYDIDLQMSSHQFT